VVEGWRESSLKGPGDFLAESDRNEHRIESQNTCVLDLALSPSACDTLDKSLASLDPAVFISFINELSEHTEGMLSPCAGGTELQRDGHCTQGDRKLKKM